MKADYLAVNIMIAVITGDIINSKMVETEIWLGTLKEELYKLGSNPKDWEIYRGDSFQLAIVDAAQALINAIKIKAAIKSKCKADVRIAIGIGDKNYDAAKITESNGIAFVRSGDKFELLKKEKQNLAIKSGLPDFDSEINLYIKLGLIVMDNWTKNFAEIVNLMIESPNISQNELGSLIGIKQSAVSRRLKQANFAEITELNEMYKSKLKELI